MLKIYFSSVVIWMIINYSAAKIFEAKIRENGWLEGQKPLKMNRLVALFILSAIPVLRLLIPVCCLLMGSITKEEFEKWREDIKNDDNS